MYRVNQKTSHLKFNKPVGDRDHEVLGIGSFGECKLYARLSTSSITRAKH
jgi:hypothetical protein